MDAPQQPQDGTQQPPEDRPVRSGAGSKPRRGEALDLVALGRARGLTWAASAALGNVSEKTARRWGADEKFKAKVSEFRAELVSDAVGLLSDSAALAVLTLRELCGPETPPAVRKGAAQGLIEILLKGREKTELEDLLRQAEAEESKQ